VPCPSKIGAEPNNFYFSTAKKVTINLAPFYRGSMVIHRNESTVQNSIFEKFERTLNQHGSHDLVQKSNPLFATFPKLQRGVGI